MSKKQDETIDIQNLIIDEQSKMIKQLMDKTVKQEKLIDKQSELIEVQQKIIGQKDKQIKLLEVFCNE